MFADVPSTQAPTGRSRGTLVLLLVVLLAAAGYAFHERSVANQLETQNAQIAASLNATKTQVDGLTTQLSTLSASQAEQAAKPQADRGEVSAPRPAVRRRHGDDPRWKKLQGQLDEQSRQIDATRQDLAGTRTELQGSIATTHDELVQLEKKGERNYFEFDVDKSGQFQKNGPVGIRLRKASSKHEFADLELLVDDFKVSKKHVNIYEPVVFHSSDTRQPVELVINAISRNHIHGYLSEPKYRTSELQAKAADNGTSANGQTAASSERQKLPKPSAGKPE
jgi:hypothetical protein